MNFNWTRDSEHGMQCLAGINPVNVLDPVCPFASPKPVRFNADRTLLEEQTMKELHLTKSDLSKECKVRFFFFPPTFLMKNNHFWIKNSLLLK